MAIGTTAAVLGAAAIGTAGSLATGAMQAGAAGKAADAQERAAMAAADVQRDAITQSRIDAYPWALQGAQAMYMYMDELGIPRPQNPILPDLNQGPFAPQPQQNALGAQQQQQPNALGQSQQAPLTGVNALRGVGPGMGQTMQGQPQAQPAQTAQPGTPSVQDMDFTESLGFQETPGYQFQVSEGEKGVMSNLAALGMRDSGPALKALTRFRQGLADQEYGNWLNRIAGVAGMGQSQTNQTNALTQNAAANIGRTYQDAGAARASGYIGQANAWGNALGNVTNTWSNTLGMLPYLQ